MPGYHFLHKTPRMHTGERVGVPDKTNQALHKWLRKFISFSYDFQHILWSSCDNIYSYLPLLHRPNHWAVVRKQNQREARGTLLRWSPSSGTPSLARLLTPLILQRGRGRGRHVLLLQHLVTWRERRPLPPAAAAPGPPLVTSYGRCLGWRPLTSNERVVSLVNQGRVTTWTFAHHLCSITCNHKEWTRLISTYIRNRFKIYK
jgi:hypothetical protein